MSARQDRVATAVRKEVATLMLFEMRDPRLAGATITNATISRDLTHARVFVSVMGSREELDAAVEALQAASGYIRSKVGPRLNLRTVPDFSFVGDDSAAKAQRLEVIFNEGNSEFGPAPTPPVLVDSDSLVLADDDEDDEDEDDDFDLDDEDLADEDYEDEDEEDDDEEDEEDE